MKPAEIFWFLVPSDLFQTCFLVLIAGIALWNIIEVWRNAKPEFWQSKWDNNTENTDDDLDAEHGSVTDLSQVVSHKAERWAEIMPGILLVIGLLGTFVGIGIALNKAAGILNVAQNDDGAVRAIKDMLPMLEGLGTKFKTSTWGILGFLIFKAWHSRYGTEEERLRWCINKSKEQLNQRRKEASNNEDSKHKALVDALKSVGDTMCLTMRDELSLNREILNNKLVESKNSTKIQTELFERLAENYQEASSRDECRHLVLNETLNSIGNAVCQNIQKEFRINHDVLKNVFAEAQGNAKNQEKLLELMQLQGLVHKEIKENTSESVKSTARMTDSVVNFIKSNEVSTIKMSEASGQIATSAEALDSAISGFSKSVASTLDDVKETLKSTLLHMSSGLEKTMQTATQKLDGSIKSSSDQSEKTAKSIQVAVDSMSHSLANTLADMNTGFVTSMKIGSDQLRESMERSSNLLSSATNGIQLAVDKMSTDVGQTQQKLQETMAAVGENIKASEDKQAKILVAVTESTKKLNTSADISERAITEILIKLDERLSRISTCNLEMINVVRNLKDSLEKFNGLLEKSLLDLEGTNEG